MTGPVAAMLVQAVFMALMVGALALLFIFRYRFVLAHQAMFIHGMRQTGVTFKGGIVWPVVNRAETVDLRVKHLSYTRAGRDSLVCQDGVRVDVSAVFLVQVAATATDVERVVTALGSQPARDVETLTQHFEARCTEALKRVASEFDYVAFLEGQRDVMQRVLAICGNDLDGFLLEDACLTFVAPSPESDYDPNSQSDVRGLAALSKAGG